MISREDFIFIIGFDGESAVVDANARRSYGKLSTRELLDKGFFRAAFSSALFAKDAGETELVIAAYNDKAGTNYKTADDLERLFGVSDEAVKRVLALG